MAAVGYAYSKQKDNLFNERGQVVFMKVRDRAKELLAGGKAFRADSLLQHSWGMHVDDWDLLACLDRMVELGEMVECRYGECAGQHRVFMSNRSA